MQGSIDCNLLQPNHDFQSYQTMGLSGMELIHFFEAGFHMNTHLIKFF
jgi:hypothetical protein